MSKTTTVTVRAGSAPKRSGLSPISVIALIIAAVLLVLAALEGGKLRSDFQYPRTTATVTHYDVNIWLSWYMALLAGPIEVVATGEFDVNGQHYTFTGQYARVALPADADAITKDLVGTTHEVWYDPTNPNVAAFFPLGLAQIGLYAGAGWLALMIGLVPIILRYKNSRAQKLEDQMNSEEGIKGDPEFQNGIALFEQKQYQASIAAFDKLVKKGADITDVHLYRARAWYALGDYEQAIKALNGAIRLDPMEKKYYLQRTKLHLKRGDNESAVRDISRAIELHRDDDDFDLYLDRAKVLEDWGRLEDALNDYTTALRLHPDAHELHLKRAAIYEKRSLHRDALEEYEAYLYSGLADERGDADAVEARIKQLYVKGWR